METVEISIAELTCITEKLLKLLTTEGIQSIRLEVDYYWNIQHDELYNLEQNPTTLTVGQISDDWQELRRVLIGDREPLAYQLVWLSSILRAIGEEVVV